MATGTNVKTDLHNMFSNHVGKFSDSLIRAYINSAIREGFPHFKRTRTATSVVTLVVNTFVYSVTTTDLPDWGMSRILMTSQLNEPDITLHTARQLQDSGTWKLHVPADIVNRNVGQTLNIEYQAEHAAISNLTDTLPIDFRYTFYSCIVSFSERMLASNYNAEGANFRALIDGSGRFRGYSEKAEDRMAQQADPAVQLPLYQAPARAHSRGVISPLMGE